jgi:hypothetical protein
MYKKASGEDRCSTVDLPILLTAVDVGIFCLITKRQRTDSELISAFEVADTKTFHVSRNGQEVSLMQ